MYLCSPSEIEKFTLSTEFVYVPWIYSIGLLVFSQNWNFCNICNQKLDLCKYSWNGFLLRNFRSTLSDLIGELFIACEMPEPPKAGFFQGLFGGGVRSLDREELCKMKMLTLILKFSSVRMPKLNQVFQNLSKKGFFVWNFKNNLKNLQIQSKILLSLLYFKISRFFRFVRFSRNSSISFF